MKFQANPISSGCYMTKKIPATSTLPAMCQHDPSKWDRKAVRCWLLRHSRQQRLWVPQVRCRRCEEMTPGITCESGISACHQSSIVAFLASRLWVEQLNVLFRSSFPVLGGFSTAWVFTRPRHHGSSWSPTNPSNSVQILWIRTSVTSGTARNQGIVLFTLLRRAGLRFAVLQWCSVK